MNDKYFAKCVARATGIRASTTTETLRRVEVALEARIDEDGPGGWSLRLLKETRWRLALRHAEATGYRRHLAHQETWRDEGVLGLFCGTPRVRHSKHGRRPPREADLTHDPLEVTCSKCWKRLLEEATDRLATFEAAKTKEAVEA